MKNKARREWCMPWLPRRPSLGQYDTFVNELQLKDETSFKNFLHINFAMSKKLEQNVGPRTEKNAFFFFFFFFFLREAVLVGMLRAFKKSSWTSPYSFLKKSYDNSNSW